MWRDGVDAVVEVGGCGIGREAGEWLRLPFGITLTEAVRRDLGTELARSRTHRSGHEYSLEQFGLSRAWVRERLPEVYDEWGFEPAGR